MINQNSKSSCSSSFSLFSSSGSIEFWASGKTLLKYGCSQDLLPTAVEASRFRHVFWGKMILLHRLDYILCLHIQVCSRTALWSVIHCDSSKNCHRLFKISLALSCFTPLNDDSREAQTFLYIWITYNVSKLQRKIRQTWFGYNFGIRKNVL